MIPPEASIDAAASAAPARKRRIRTHAVLLSLVAIGFFVAFVVASAIRSQAG